MASGEPAKVMCCEAKFIGFAHKPRPCKNRAKVTRDGKPYCGVHDPERRKARQEEYVAKVRAKIDANNLGYTRRRLVFEACAGVSDADLRRVIEVGGVATILAKGGKP